MTSSVASGERLNSPKDFLRSDIPSNVVFCAVDVDDPGSDVGVAWGLVVGLVDCRIAAVELTETKAVFAKAVQSVFLLPGLE
mgnify:CR=1 FL=1